MLSPWGHLWLPELQDKSLEHRHLIPAILQNFHAPALSKVRNSSSCGHHRAPGQAPLPSQRMPANSFLEVHLGDVTSLLEARVSEIWKRGLQWLSSHLNDTQEDNS